MNWEEYLRHRDHIEKEYKVDMAALKLLYPEEWAKDHQAKVKVTGKRSKY